MVDYSHFFAQELDRIRQEERYRVFQNIERQAGQFPKALWNPESSSGTVTDVQSQVGKKEITLWCSNDYLGMGQHNAVITAMQDACLLYTSPSPRDQRGSRMPSSA